MWTENDRLQTWAGYDTIHDSAHLNYKWNIFTILFDVESETTTKTAATIKDSCAPSCYSFHFIHATPKYTEFPLKWYTVIHVQLSHRNYYVYNTLLTKLSYVNEQLVDSGMTAQHPVRPTPTSPRNARQHARVIMNQCIRNCTGIRITLSLKNTGAYLSTEEFLRSKK